MKYWRGYLVAAILAACTWAFREFAEAHSQLVDMVYPYLTRIVQDVLHAEELPSINAENMKSKLEEYRNDSIDYLKRCGL